MSDDEYLDPEAQYSTEGDTHASAEPEPLIYARESFDTPSNLPPLNESNKSGK